MARSNLVHDPKQKKLGKLPPKHDYRTLHFSDYIKREAIEKAPKRVSYSKAVNVPFGMLMNDTLGDCTIAGALHHNMVLDFNTETPGKCFIPTDAMVLEGYRRIDGYDPGDPNSDQGGVLLDVLNAWRKDGIGGRKILAFAKVNLRSANDLKAAIHIFGGLYAGVQLPNSAQSQKVWDSAPGRNGAPGSWGGHCVDLHDYDSKGATCVTWGETQKMTWRFFHKYFDEAFVVVSEDWLNADKISPTGLNLDQLLADVQKVA